MMVEFAEATARFAAWLARAAVYEPLKTLYMNGPAIGGYGFWESLPPEEICATLTRVEASFWHKTLPSVAMCEQLIERKTDAFVIGTIAFVVCGTILLVVVQSTCRCIVVRPIVDAIAKLGRIRQ
jgi:hypothetical protein